MSKISETVHGIHHLDAMSSQDTWLNSLHPLAKLLTTILYIGTVVSFHKYNLIGLAGMSIYLIVLMLIGEISLNQSVKQVKVVLLLVCAVGIANPFLDRTEVIKLGNVAITGGMISMVTLMMKGIFSVLASYLLIMTTSIENICYALRIMHMPKIIVTIILLIYRYIIVMLKEAERISIAYSLRAPNQKGLHYKAWGSFIGQLLLRSVDRAQEVYESMTLRGFTGEFFHVGSCKLDVKSMIYLLLWIWIIILLRIFPIFQLVGNLFT